METIRIIRHRKIRDNKLWLDIEDAVNTTLNKTSNLGLNQHSKSSRCSTNLRHATDPTQFALELRLIQSPCEWI
jgi:hypothetical protein